MRLDSAFRAVLIFAAACSAPAFAATHTITVGPGGSLTFSPATITIPPGDTITFQSNAGFAHNAVSDDGTTFSSGPAAAGPWTYVTPPLAAGTYGFHCTVHGSAGSGMFGSITVQTTPVTLQEFGVD
jgi:plastocyanin